MVEPPGTAPGSDPVIPCAFMSIVPVAGDKGNVGQRGAGCKGAGACAAQGANDCFSPQAKLILSCLASAARDA